MTAEPCGAAQAVSALGGRLTVWAVCDKPSNHDDPFSEIGSVRTDPWHGQTLEADDGASIKISWRSSRGHQ